ncbi:MAG TPA: protein kinase, partial [Polyangiaceae bacterium]|nr:protein kinase [Polyangiaceae bacterium]
MEPVARWAPPPRVEEFVLGRPLGRGGMGQVYSARDTLLDREVALKFLAVVDAQSSARRRFASEARAIARLSHPNVAGIYRIGEFEQRPFLVYELVRGQALSELMLPLDWRQVLSLACDLCAGLAAIHRAGLVHRDIKPANLMLDEEGVGKVIDFGLARLRHDTTPPLPNDDFAPLSEHQTRDGTLVGTPAFLPPEVWGGGEADARSDLFSFGLVLRELLLGDRARRHGSIHTLAEGARRGFDTLRSERPDVPASFAQLIDRCLRVLPLERYATAEALLPELLLLRDVLLGAHLVQPVRSREAETVAASLSRVWARQDEFVGELYRRMFEQHPDLRSLFPNELAGQQKKLLHALRLTVEGLRHTER